MGLTGDHDAAVLDLGLPGLDGLEVLSAVGWFHWERFEVLPVGPGVVLSSPVYPVGVVKFDETFQKTVEIYREHLTNLMMMQADSEMAGGFGYVPWIQKAPDIKEIGRAHV